MTTHKLKKLRLEVGQLNVKEWSIGTLEWGLTRDISDETLQEIKAELRKRAK